MPPPSGRPLPRPRGVWGCRRQETRHVSVPLRRAGGAQTVSHQTRHHHLQLPGPQCFSPDFVSRRIRLDPPWPGTVSWESVLWWTGQGFRAMMDPTYCVLKTRQKKRHPCLSYTTVGVWRGRKQRSLRVVRKSHSEFCTYCNYCFLSVVFYTADCCRHICYRCKQ